MNKVQTVFCLTVLLLSISPARSWIPDSPYVTDLTEKDFASQVNGDKYLVVFYLPGCPHCQAYIPHFNLFAEKYRAVAKFGKVDCSRHFSFCRRTGVSGVPTLELFYGTNYKVYSGYRNEADLAKFLTNTEHMTPFFDYDVATKKYSLKTRYASSEENTTPRMILFSLFALSSILAMIFWRDITNKFSKKGIPAKQETFCLLPVQSEATLQQSSQQNLQELS